MEECEMKYYVASRRLVNKPFDKLLCDQELAEREKQLNVQTLVFFEGR